MTPTCMEMKPKHWKLLAGVSLATVFCAALAATEADNTASGKAEKRVTAYQTWGYQPWWMKANWRALDLGQWQRVIFFELPIAANGTIGGMETLPVQWRSMAKQAAVCGTAFDLAFTLFDELKFEQIFSSASRRSTLLEEIITLTKQAGATGVHLDVEIYKPISQEAAQGYREFVQQLGRRLRELGPSHILSIFGVVGAAQELLDKPTIEALDFIVVQGYDMHWKAGPAAGSVAPLKGNHRLTWEKSLQYYLDLEVERSRLLFSFPYYGYEWPVTSAAPGSATSGTGKEISYAPLPRQWVPNIQISALKQSQRYGSQRDAETGSPYYLYQDEKGKWWQGWYEDEISLAEKLAFIEKERLAGIAVFPLGYDAGKLGSVLARRWGSRPQCHPTPS